MKNFRFKKLTHDYSIDSNGWILNVRFKKNFGFLSFKTPIQKEVTYSKGPAVRYQRHRIIGIGFTNSKNEYSGLAFFDPHIRLLIFLIIFLGITYVSLSIFSGLIFASLFYFLILYLSSEDDNKLLCQCQRMFEINT